MVAVPAATGTEISINCFDIGATEPRNVTFTPSDAATGLTPKSCGDGSDKAPEDEKDVRS